jgi:hypothetical protein
MVILLSFWGGLRLKIKKKNSTPSLIEELQLVLIDLHTKLYFAGRCGVNFSSLEPPRR